MNVSFNPDAWDDILHWAEHDRSLHRRILALMSDIRRSPHAGIGKPEPLKGPFSGWWSRRINDQHRLIYRVAGRARDDQRIEIIACRYHY